MGTNIIFHQVSFITFSMAAVIQLAVSMDYSIFLSHRYDEERAKGLTVRQSIMTACKASFAAVSSSAMTTICGFSALIFMQYGIGADIGLVLAKGVFLSFVCVMLLLPVLLVLFAGLIERTRHRSFIHFSPAFCKIVVKLRWVLLAAGVLLVIPAYLGQLNVDFLYGDSSGTGSGDQMSREKEAIEDVFGISAQMVLLMPNGDIVAEQELVADLEQTPGVKSVQAVVNLADPAIPRELLPTALLDNFVGSEYGRIIVNVTTVTENPAMFTVVEKIRAAAAAYYGDRYYLVGKAASIADIRDSVQVDIRETNIISMVAVGVIILLVFRSLLLPVLLVAVIQSAIYINMAVPFFLGQPLVFIGYLIVGSLQLGATIDYAILMASRYIEARAVLPKKEAAAEAIGRSGISVLTSGLILTTAGLAEAYLSALPSISSIGMLIGRGALLSACMVLVILPALLIIFDRPLQILTLKTNFYRQDHRRGGTKNEKN
ncbi:MAG: MMPL family transporter [Clostridiales bacterium]